MPPLSSLLSFPRQGLSLRSHSSASFSPLPLLGLLSADFPLLLRVGAMSSSSSTGFNEAMSSKTEIANQKRMIMRDTLEKVHSLSSDIFLFTVQWEDLEEHFDAMQKAIDDQVRELERKQQLLEWRSKYATQRWKDIQSRSEEIERKERDLEELGLDLGEVEYREWRFKKRKAELKEWNAELEIKERGLSDRADELNLKEANLSSLERGLLEKTQDVELKQKQLEERETELGRKENRFAERYKVFLKNERCLNTMFARSRGEEVEDCEIRFYTTMGGKDMLEFLNSRAIDHEIMRGEVTSALNMSSNPAKLVLDAMQGFHGDGSGGRFALTVVRRSCILLLEQLIRMEPRILSPDRDRAKLLAIEWKAKMKVDSDQNLEVLGFLLLVVCYNLASEFRKYELAKMIVDVGHYTHAPALCRRLGLVDMVDDIIQHLIQDNRTADAAKFSREFNMLPQMSEEP